ncbi:MAG: beta-ketoacyl synthase chain length factor [Xanthomonadaceae bacterium]|nr:beta-ketoacyl synthase chain length factor [Xanthomonadaceae bacterium]MDE1964522.1 beta-ketoacyl synthase chain length factor [Xanthomonadaceae bacterium]
MSGLQVTIEGIGLWAAQATGLDDLARLLDGIDVAAPAARPPAAMLPANERRRAPESVLLAAEVAGQAVAQSGRDAAELACVFTSSHGDQGITDYLCATLASAPTEVSPTKFHNSVHNAPVGYWTIASGCHAASTALCAHRESFGAGLLEAACLVAAERRPVLLVCSDVATSGPLTEMAGCTLAFGTAMVVAPASGRPSLARLGLQLAPGHPGEVAWPAPLQAWHDGNPAADALRLLVPLARRASAAVAAAGPGLTLHMQLEYPA